MSKDRNERYGLHLHGSERPLPFVEPYRTIGELNEIERFKLARHPLEVIDAIIDRYAVEGPGAIATVPGEVERLKWAGIYPQKQGGDAFMMRVKVPGGFLTSAQAREYAAELRGILIATGASDGRMEEGSMRIDANVSVHKIGTSFGTRCEIKNLNSLRSLQRAIEFEAQRQYELIEDGGVVRQETRHWDENDGRTHTLRVKEDADDYRYFLEPDLVPLAPSAEWIEQVRASLPSLPAERREHLAVTTGQAADSEAVMSVVERGQDHYVLAVGHVGGDTARALVYVKEAFAYTSARAVSHSCT